ncbi:putative plant self-incompatibility S1 [Arabidopsis thaliana]
MTFNNKSHFPMLFMIFSIFILFVSALNFPNAPVEAPSSDPDGYLPLAKKHVVIRNVNGTWDFSFHVNFWKNTKFRCHFTWHNGGSHYFNIFKVYRDDNPDGRFPVCKECIWEVGKYGDNGHICRIVRDGRHLPYCFKWEDSP